MTRSCSCFANAVGDGSVNIAECFDLSSFLGSTEEFELSESEEAELARRQAELADLFKKSAKDLFGDAIDKADQIRREQADLAKRYSKKRKDNDGQAAAPASTSPPAGGAQDSKGAGQTPTKKEILKPSTKQLLERLGQDTSLSGHLEARARRPAESPL